MSKLILFVYLITYVISLRVLIILSDYAVKNSELRCFLRSHG